MAEVGASRCLAGYSVGEADAKNYLDYSNMIDIYYKKPEWEDWVCWPCKTKTEAKQVKETLKKQGYIIKDYPTKLTITT